MGFREVYFGVVRFWIFATAAAAFVTSIQSFQSDELFRKTLYAVDPSNVSPLFGRLFGIWTAVTSVLRMLTAVYTFNRPLYFAAIWSYLMAFAHFATEIWIYGTIDFYAAGFAPIVVSSSTTLLMLGGLLCWPAARKQHKE